MATDMLNLLHVLLIFCFIWLPNAGGDVKQSFLCLHTEPPDGFFKLKDPHDMELHKRVFDTPTPTEDDAVDVTGLVTGFNVEIMDALASKGGWTVKYFQLNGFPGDTYAGLQHVWPANLTRFACDVNSELLVPAALMKVDFLIPVVPYGFIVVGPTPKVMTQPWLERLFTFLKPFELEVWGCIVLFILVSAATMFFLDDHAESYGHFLYAAIISFSGQNGFKPTSAESKIYHTSFGLVMLIIVSCYTANLATVLIAEKNKQQLITGINSFVELGVPACAWEAHVKQLKDMYPAIDFVGFPKKNGIRNMIEAARLGKTCRGIVGTDVHLKYFLMQDQVCDMQLLGQTLNLGYYAIPFLRPNGLVANTNVQQHNTIIVEMLHKGEVDDITARYFPPDPRAALDCGGAGEAEEANEADGSDESMSINDFGGIFVIASVGLFASILLSLRKRTMKHVRKSWLQRTSLGQSDVGAKTTQPVEVPLEINTPMQADDDIASRLKVIEAQQIRILEVVERHQNLKSMVNIGSI